MCLSTMTRPDISSGVRAVACLSHNPTKRQWKAVSKSMAHLHEARFMGLTFVRGSGGDLEAFYHKSITFIWEKAFRATTAFIHDASSCYRPL